MPVFRYLNSVAPFSFPLNLLNMADVPCLGELDDSFLALGLLLDSGGTGFALYLLRDSRGTGYAGSPSGIGDTPPAVYNDPILP